jgi:hypothetical protein
MFIYFLDKTTDGYANIIHGFEVTYREIFKGRYISFCLRDTVINEFV